MKGNLFLSFSALFVAACAYPYSWLDTRPGQLTQPHSVKLLMEGASNFSHELLLELLHSTASPSRENANILFSPLGVASVLGLLRLAAKGNTRIELDRISLFSSDESVDIDHAFQSLYRILMTSQLEKSGRHNSELVSSNMFFLDYRTRIYKSYYQAAKENYFADFQSADFRERLDDSRRAINKYVNHKSRGHVPNLLGIGDVTESTELVIANAVFFQSRWMYEFDNRMTRPGNFTLLNGDKVEVPMMQQREFLKHCVSCKDDVSDEQCSNEAAPDMVVMPFRDRQRRLYILLPNARITLREIEDKFSAELERWKAGLSLGNVDLKIPKFKLEYEVDMKRSLWGLGLKHLFWNGNLEGFAPKSGLVSSFTHKAAMSVEEGGVTAGAGTGVVTYTRSFSPPIRMSVDRPFIFFIEDVTTRAVAFLGEVSDPRYTIQSES